ncbi:sensor histidine kinase [Sphaerisporangium corydalis]|uniref:histidine kinase n=1 Tax=Sphaerisporangium corydalis TaxID=1441875 RepID=A0ABV9EA67_9ACTN|nr:histidine kinase [Sphaerisporangium corydalis]
MSAPSPGLLVAAAAPALFAVAESLGRSAGVPAVAGPGRGPLMLVLALVALATTLPFALLWAQPAVAAVVVTAASVLSLTAFETLTVAGVGVQLAVGYRLGRAGSQRLAVLLAVPFPVLALAGTPAGETRVLTLLLASLAPACALAGIARRARGEAMESGAARRVVDGTLLEYTARGERARIARELHDVVAHHISMVAVQAETARLTTPGMPAAGAERLSAIGDTARAALTEMRRLLGVLREDARAEPADRRPQPGLSLRELNELLDESRDASGTGTRLILRGPPVALGPGVELAAYRIVQEALTNARRHAPGAAVDVELHYTEDALTLLIRDNGPGTPPPAAPDRERPPASAPRERGCPGASAPRERGGPGASAPPEGPDAWSPAGGHGLAGMRERASAVGGRLRAGPGAGGGFLVEARLPGKDEAAG